MSDAPERIWASKSTNGNCVVSFSSQSDEYCIEYVRADLVLQWQPVGDDTPKDVVLLLGWYGFGDKWETCTDYYHNSRGGWLHGQATHWMPLPAPPAASSNG